VLQDGKVSQLEHVFIRGSKVRCCTCFLVYVIHGIILVNPSCLVIDLRIYLDRFMVIPDILKHAPMFKRLDARIKVYMLFEPWMQNDIRISIHISNKHLTLLA